MTSSTPKPRRAIPDNNNNSNNVASSSQQQQPQQQPANNNNNNQVLLLAPPWEGIAKLLSATMQRDDENDVARALHSLGTLLAANHETFQQNLEEARSLGAHVRIIDAMRKWQHSKNVQSMGCYCFVALTYQNAHANVAICKSGGIEAIMDAMKIFPDSFLIPSNGCLAFANIFCHIDDDDQSDVILQVADCFVHKLDGIPLTANAMKKFPNDKHLQQGGCLLFKNLSLIKEFHNALKKAGAITAVAMALEKHHDDEQVKKHADAFFKNLFVG